MAKYIYIYIYIYIQILPGLNRLYLIPLPNLCALWTIWSRDSLIAALITGGSKCCNSFWAWCNGYDWDTHRSLLSIPFINFGRKSLAVSSWTVWNLNGRHGWKIFFIRIWYEYWTYLPNHLRWSVVRCMFPRDCPLVPFHRWLYRTICNAYVMINRLKLSKMVLNEHHHSHICTLD